MNTTQLYHHIERLRNCHKTYSQAARALGLDPRHFRRVRNGQLAKPTEQLIITAGRLLSARLLIRELVRSGALKPGDINRAWRTIHGFESKVS